MGINQMNPPKYSNDFHAGTYNLDDFGYYGGYYLEGTNTGAEKKQFRIIYFDDDGASNALQIGSLVTSGAGGFSHVSVLAGELINSKINGATKLEVAADYTTCYNTMRFLTSAGITVNDGVNDYDGLTQNVVISGTTMTFKEGILTGVA